MKLKAQSRLKDLHRLLSQLTTEQKEIIELLFLQGFSQNEVAKIKDMPLGSKGYSKKRQRGLWFL